MKKLSWRHKQWLERHRLLSAKRRYRQRYGKGGRDAWDLPSKPRYQFRYESATGTGIAWADKRVPMPRVFCLTENYEESAQRLEAVRENLRTSVQLSRIARAAGRVLRPRSRTPQYLDFTTIEQCSPSAALVLASEFDRARRLLPFTIRVVDRENWDPEFVAMLDDVGFFELLGIPPSNRIVRPQGSEIVRFKSGAVVGNAAANDLLQTMADLVLDADPSALDNDELFEPRVNLFGALVEATENACQHAYEDEPDPGNYTVRNWWMTGAVDKAAKRVTIVVYDQGVSIPFTLPQWAGSPTIDRAIRYLARRGPPRDDLDYDGVRLRLAVTAATSSTGLRHRGKGLPAFKAVIDQCQRGSLRIVSRRGEFIYEKGHKPIGRSVVTPLQGTLVEWDLWL